MTKILSTLAWIIMVIGLIIVIAWIAGFHLEMYDYIVGKACVLWWHNDIVYYWNW